MPITHLPLSQLLTSTDPSEFASRRALADINIKVAKAKKVVVVSGAGISCSSGIPDFRSADGLYALVKARYPDSFVTGRDLFSSGLFQNPQTASIFYTFIAELSLACEAAQPTRTHHFINRLEAKGKLLRSYTQNVDGLERRIGLESGGRGLGLKKNGTRNVELHGDLGRVRCVLCFHDYEAKAEWIAMFREGDAPDCPACEERCSDRLKRLARPTPVGTLRPSIVLYDEPHPLGDDIGQLQSYDLRRGPDVLLIMGTSLKVHGLKRLVKDFAKAVHDKKGGTVVFVNATPPSKEWEGVIDYHVQGETDRWVEKCEEDWKRVRPQDWERQTVLDGDVIVNVGAGKSRKKTSKKGVVPPTGLPTPLASQLPTPPASQTSPASEEVTADAQTAPIVFRDITDVANIVAGAGKRGKKTTTKKGAVIVSQLPTPPQSQSPPLSPMQRLALATQSSTPVTQFASPPSSPSKRRAHTTAMSAGPNSPSKRNKSVSHPTAPATTIISVTPGQGNLFSSPTKAPLSCVRGDHGNEALLVDNDEDTLSVEIFGSPLRVVKDKVTRAKPKPKPMPKARATPISSTLDKENAPPTTRARRTAAGKA